MPGTLLSTQYKTMNKKVLVPALQTWVQWTVFHMKVWEEGRSLEKGMETPSSTLAWRIPMDWGAWWAAGHGLTKNQTRLKQLGTHGREEPNHVRFYYSVFSLTSSISHRDTQTHRSFSPPLLSALGFERCTHLSHSQPQSSLQYQSDVRMSILLPVVAF